MLWSVPGDGSGVTSIVPAVPSPTGVADVFALQGDNTVQAITSDGTVAWTASVPPNSSFAGYANLVPDFQGGLVVYNSLDGSITKLDGITGQPYPSCLNARPPMAVHTDGTIFAIQGANTVGVSVIGIDPVTGTQKFSVPLTVQPYNNLSEDLPCSIGTVFGPVGVSGFIVAGDGNAYLGYDYPEVKLARRTPGQLTCGCYESAVRALMTKSL